jgi:hypothetical protein
MVWLCLTSCYLQALIVSRTRVGSGAKPQIAALLSTCNGRSSILDRHSDAMPTTLALVSHDCEFNAPDAPSLQWHGPAVTKLRLTTPSQNLLT